MALEKFHYTTESGKKLSLPHFQDVLKFGILRKLRKIDEEEQMFFILESVLTEKQLEVVDEMSAEEVGKFLSEWQEESNIDTSKSDGDSEDN